MRRVQIPGRDSCPCCRWPGPFLGYRALNREPLPTCEKCGRIVSGSHEGKTLRVSNTGVAFWHEDEAFLNGTAAQRQMLLFPPPLPAEGGDA